jgi:hypothetical protein
MVGEYQKGELQIKLSRIYSSALSKTSLRIKFEVLTAVTMKNALVTSHKMTFFIFEDTSHNET